jgi:hypothetical protein
MPLLPKVFRQSTSKYPLMAEVREEKNDDQFNEGNFSGSLSVLADAMVNLQIQEGQPEHLFNFVGRNSFHIQ